MNAIVELKGKAVSRNLGRRRPTLTRDEMFRLWRAAIKDDDGLANVAIQKVYEDMMAFNRERADAVIDLTVRRNPAAGVAFRGLLSDAQQCQHDAQIGLATSAVVATAGGALRASPYSMPGLSHEDDHASLRQDSAEQPGR